MTQQREKPFTKRWEGRESYVSNKAKMHVKQKPTCGVSLVSVYTCAFPFIFGPHPDQHTQTSSPRVTFETVEKNRKSVMRFLELASKANGLLYGNISYFAFFCPCEHILFNN